MLMLGTLALTSREEIRTTRSPGIPLFVVVGAIGGVAVARRRCSIGGRLSEAEVPEAEHQT